MKKIQDLRAALNKQFFERSALVDGMLTSLISGDPLLMIGPPGTAKSMICRAVCQALQGNYFAWCLNKLTTPEEMFGPISLKALEQDRYLRMTAGKLPGADVAFLDEIFKSSSAILNSLLTILNEKEFYNDSKPVQVPLKVLYAASNEVPQGEELSAMYDRFVLKFYTDYVKEEQSVESLFLGMAKVQIPTIDLAYITHLQTIAACPTKADVDPVLPALKTIRRTVENEGIAVSDRKWVQAVRVLKAFSMLNEHKTIEESDLDILEHVLWSNTEQRAKVRKIVGAVSNPLGEKILSIADGAKEMYDAVNSGATESVEGFKKIKHAVGQLEKLGDPNTNSKLKQAIAQVKGLQHHIAKEKLGIVD